MIIMNGSELAKEKLKEFKSEFAKLLRPPTLAILSIGSDAVMLKFISQKKKTAADLGVKIIERVFKPEDSGAKIRSVIAGFAHDKKIDGIIMQLPVPKKFNTQDILNAIPVTKDIDLLSSRAVGDFITGKTKLMPPVVGAISDLAETYDIDFAGKRIAIIGAGRLVGKSVAAWLLRQDMGFAVVTEKTKNQETIIREADIIISGAGKKIINSNMIKDGAVIFDCGTSEAGGKITGDADFDSVAKKAYAVTPVPSGIGPLTVIWIFKNLLQFSKHL